MCRSKSSVHGGEEKPSVPEPTATDDARPLYPVKRGAEKKSNRESKESLYPEKRGLVSDKKPRLVSSPYKSHT